MKPASASHPVSTVSEHPLAGALDGVSVVDFSQIAAGPVCTMLLADMGADVIKVEPPGGEVGRTLGPPFIGGESAVFLSVNRGKRSVVIDMKTQAGRDHAYQLLETADVLVESFRPGVADRLGIGHEAMRARYPGIIYCSVSAYGQSGPSADRPGVDGVLQAATGLMSITGAEGERPSKLQAPVVDMVTGFHATIAVLAALRQRDLGRAPGQLDVSLFASSLMLQQVPLTAYLASGELPKRSGSGAPYATPNEAYRTADGHVLIAAYQPARWRRFCEAIGCPDLADDPRYKTLADRMAHRDRLRRDLEIILAGRSTKAWCDLLDAADIICSPVADYAGLMASPQLDASALLTHMVHPSAGDVVMPGFAIGGPPLPARRPSPLLGEHDDLLDPLLGNTPPVG